MVELGNAAVPAATAAAEGLSFERFAIHRLTHVPRPEPEGEPGAVDDAGVRTVLAAIVAAHGSFAAADEPSPALVAAWIKAPGEDQFGFFVGGAPALPGVRPSLREPGRDAVLFPPGSIGERVGGAALDGLVGRFPCWLRCAGQPDVLWRETDRDTALTDGGFLRFASHIGQPFAWLVVAEPLAHAAVDRQLTSLMTEIPRLRQNTASEPDRIALERAEARYRELTKAGVSGMWKVHVLVGGLTPPAARTSAALLCGAGRIDSLPYVLAPGAGVGSFAAAWAAQTAHGDLRSPVDGSADLLAALTAPPAQELPGVRLVAGNAFDVTPEEDAGAGPALGTILDRAYESAGTFRVAPGTLNRHAFIAGATGSGKSQTTRRLLEELSRAPVPVPWLVIEPAKAEYAGMAGRLAGVAPVVRITPGDPALPPASLNPLEPAPGFPLQSHLDLVRALFLAAFEAAEPFPQVLAHALTLVYREAGWDLVTGRPRPATKQSLRRSDAREPATPSYPRLDELQDAARRVVDGIGYGREVTANVRGFIDVRLGGLVEGTPGRFFQGGHPLDVEGLLDTNTVLELEGVTDDQDKAFVMGSVVIRVVEHLRVKYGRDGCDHLRHVTVIEEAHRLLKHVETGPAAAAVELFASLLAEIRAYGDGIVVVEQIPSKVVTDVIKNTALKVVHRLPALDDREVVGATMNLSEAQSRAVVAFPPGSAAVSVDGMDRPMLVQVTAAPGRESAAGAETVPPLLGRRSALCGEDCCRRACTLDEMNEARHVALAARHVLWAEAVTVAFLAGFVAPRAQDDVRAELRMVPARTRACALSYAVEACVSVRRHLMTRWLDADDFASVLHAELVGQVEGAIPPVEEPRRWQAGTRRYADVRRRLRRLASEGGQVSDALLAGWADRGLHLNGTDPDTVLAELDAREARDPTLPQVMLGDPNRSGLRRALTELVGSVQKPDVLRAVRGCVVGQSADAVAYLIADRLAGAGMEVVAS